MYTGLSRTGGGGSENLQISVTSLMDDPLIHFVLRKRAICPVSGKQTTLIRQNHLIGKIKERKIN